MSYEEAFGPAEAHYKNVCIHQTFGHLYPEQTHYEGTVRIASDIYGQTAVLDECPNLPESSPWWYEAITNFTCDVSKDMEGGEVAAFKISVEIVEFIEELEQWQIDEEAVPEEWSEIHIKQQSKTILVKAF